MIVLNSALKRRRENLIAMEQVLNTDIVYIKTMLLAKNGSVAVSILSFVEGTLA